MHQIIKSKIKNNVISKLALVWDMYVQEDIYIHKHTPWYNCSFIGWRTEYELVTVIAPLRRGMVDWGAEGEGELSM